MHMVIRTNDAASINHWNVRRKKIYYVDENLTVDPFTGQGIQIGS